MRHPTAYLCVSCGDVRDSLPIIREWHSECERPCYEDLETTFCPRCRRDALEAAEECAICGKLTAESYIITNEEDERVCEGCYYAKDEFPSLFTILRNRRRRNDGETIRVNEHLCVAACGN